MGNSILGMIVQGPTGIIVGNQFEGNGSDLYVNFKNGVIMQNIFGSSIATGSTYRLAEGTSYNISLENMHLYSFADTVQNAGESNVFIENKVSDLCCIELTEDDRRRFKFLIAQIISC